MVADFIQDESTDDPGHNVYYCAPLCSLLSSERKRRLSRKKSLIILLSEGSAKPLRAMVPVQWLQN